MLTDRLYGLSDRPLHGLADLPVQFGLVDRVFMVKRSVLVIALRLNLKLYIVTDLPGAFRPHLHMFKAALNS